jgi:uncharacterized iron-regulated membrane protein
MVLSSTTRIIAAVIAGLLRWWERWRRWQHKVNKIPRQEGRVDWLPLADGH